MQTHSPKEITRLLVAWGGGDQSALDELAPLVHSELHRLAHHYMRHERPGHTLQTSALVNEAYLRLIDVQHVNWQDKTHFLAMAARLMEARASINVTDLLLGSLVVTENGDDAAGDEPAEPGVADVSVVVLVTAGPPTGSSCSWLG